MGGGWILVVDDESMNRMLLRKVLKTGHEVAEASNAEEALSIFSERDGGALRLVLCDQLMPGRVGTELAAALRDQQSEAPVILLTGCDDDPRVDEACESGAVTEVLPKPWRPIELRSLIERFLV